ncbi:MAG: class II aldolase/adducin family protein [Dehalococcoidia bacterium]
MGWDVEKRSVVEAAQNLLARGLVAATSGNVSVYLGEKDDSKLIAVTPAGMPYETMTAGQIVVIDFEGEVVEGDGNPSSESLTHIAIYKARPDVRCVIHTHSVYASVLAVAGIELPPIIDELVVYLGGPVKVAEYGFPGTEELGEVACAALEDRNAVLLRNHGVVGVGRSTEDALRACELVERAAQIFLHATALGKVGVLPPEVVEAERNIFKMMQGHSQE